MVDHPGSQPANHLQGSALGGNSCHSTATHRLEALSRSESKKDEQGIRRNGIFLIFLKRKQDIKVNQGRIG